MLKLTRQELALVAITAVWGSTFLIVHRAMQVSGPWFFVGVRFAAAGVISLLIFGRALRGLTRRDLVAGTLIGVMVYLGYGLQTVGLQSIDSSTSAFITSFYVPLVPLAQWVFLKKRPGTMAFVGVALAFAGLMLLADPGTVRLGASSGEITTLISTIPIALEIILISYFAGRVHLQRVIVIQLFVAGALSLGTMPLVREAAPAFGWSWFGAAIGLGAASCLIQVTMNWAQKTVSPTRATIIYTGEPVWAGIVGRIAGERLPLLSILGAVLVIAGSLVSELRRGGGDAAAEPAEAGRPGGS